MVKASGVLTGVGRTEWQRARGMATPPAGPGACGMQRPREELQGTGCLPLWPGL